MNNFTNYTERARQLMLTAPVADAFVALNEYADAHGSCPSCGAAVGRFEHERCTHARSCESLIADATATLDELTGEAFTVDERRAIEAARRARSRADWSLLPSRACGCGQRFYVEHARQTVCRDCMGDSGFYPVPDFALADSTPDAGKIGPSFADVRAVADADRRGDFDAAKRADRESSFDVREPAVDVDELPWIVMCHVSGGVTGTRQAPLKGIAGNVKRFASEDDARAEAVRLTNASRTSRATFAYWPQLADESAK
jgi:hypothetical protein